MMPGDARKPIGVRLPPTITPPPSGSTLHYAMPQRARKPWPRRAWNWVRYHLEDRVGNAIMWMIAPIFVGLGVMVIYRPITLMRLLFFLFGGK